MFLKYRLEIIALCLVGILMNSGNIIVHVVMYFLFFFNLLMSLLVIREIQTNQNRISDLMRQLNNVKTKEQKIMKIIFWLLLPTLIILSVLTKEWVLIGLTLLTVILELIKVKQLKLKLKNYNEIDKLQNTDN